MPAFTVTASTEIDKPLEEVHQVISDFGTWPHWSPWLCLEPEAKLEFEGVAATIGHGYRWAGEKVGSGEMHWTGFSGNRQLTAQLSFLKPFKSSASVSFNLTPQGGGTLVEWTMDSKLPFFMFFMVKTMTGMITMDYQRGLAMLKDYCEQGEVHGEVETMGIVDSPAYSFVGIDGKTSFSGGCDLIGDMFERVVQQFNETDLTTSGNFMTVYHDMNVKTGQFAFTAAMPVSIEDAENVGQLKAGQISSCKAYKVVHTGPYRHLGNAWASAMADMRHLKLKASKSVKPFEVYLNDPSTAKENDLVTEIYLPVR